MNTERINALAYHIETLKRTCRDEVGGKTGLFQMSRWNFRCGSPACIAGHAVSLYGHEIGYVNGMDTMTSAALALDIDTGDVRELFAPSEEETGGWSMDHIEPEMAAWVLRTYAETGEVRWSDAINLYAKNMPQSAPCPE